MRRTSKREDRSRAAPRARKKIGTLPCSKLFFITTPNTEIAYLPTPRRAHQSPRRAPHLMALLKLRTDRATLVAFGVCPWNSQELSMSRFTTAASAILKDSS